MKLNLCLLIILSFFLGTTILSQNPEWIVYDTTNSGLLCNYVSALTIDSSDTKWIVTSCGLVEFDNTNWYGYNYTTSPQTVISIDAIGNKWIGRWTIIGGGGGLLKIDENGNRTEYLASNSGLPNNRIGDIAIDDADNKWIATSGGLAKLSDTIWTVYDTTNSEIPSNGVTCITLDETGNKWIGTSNGLAKFDNTNWEEFNTTNSQLPGNKVKCITIDNSGIIWMGISIADYPNRDIALVRIEGNNWTVYDYSNTSISDDLITCIVASESGTIWFGSLGGIVAFDGSSYTVYSSLNAELPGDHIMDIVIDDSNNKWIAYDSEEPVPNGLAVFNEGGIVSVSEWILEESGTTNNLWGVSFNDNNNGTVVGFEGTILRTVDGGVSWVKQSSGVTDFLWDVLFIGDNAGVIVGDRTIFRTINGGETWVKNSSGITGSHRLRAVSFANSKLGTAVGTDGTILRTVDGGISWVKQSAVVSKWLWGIHFINDSLGFIVGDNGTILRSDNAGETWVEQQSGVNERLYDVCFSDNNKGIIVGSGGIVLKTTDAGETWNSLSSGTTISLCDVHFADANTGIAVGGGSIGLDSNGEILITTDGGETWQNQLIGDYAGTHSIWTTENGIGIVVGRDGMILRKTIGGITSVETNELKVKAIPRKYTLYQNYPNPFNPSTTIKYQIPLNEKRETKNVILKIFDVLGKEVATLINEKQKPGNYEVEWNAVSQSSGIYFYQLTAGQFVETKKLVVLK